MYLLDRIVFRQCNETIVSPLWGELVRSSTVMVDCSPLRGISAMNSNVYDDIEEPFYASERHVGSIDALNGLDSFAISVWILASSSPSYQVIASIGRGCAEVRLAQFQEHFVISFLDASGSCRVLQVKQVKLDPFSLTHVVASWNATSLSVYVNGQEIVSPETNFSTAVWRKESSLQLFSDHDTSTVFQGSLLQLDMFENLTLHENVLELFRQGPSAVTLAPIKLVTEPQHDLWIPQDQTLPLVWSIGGLNVSQRDLRVEFLSLPRFGSLQMNGLHVKNASQWTIPANKTSLSVEYMLDSSDYFTTPSTNARGVDLGLPRESFEFGLVLLDELGGIHRSPSVSQTIHIVHVNHIPSLETPEKIQQSNDDGEPVVVNDIRLTDRDMDMNRVRVDLSTAFGRLSLNPFHRSMADFDSCRARTFSSWQCVGDGVADRSMTFVAVPSAVNLILQDLVYEPIVLMEDHVVIQIYDGQGGDCLSAQEHELPLQNGSHATIHRGCFQVNSTIPILPPPPSRSDDNGIFGIPNLDFRRFDLADLLFWLVVLVMIVGCCACVRSCRRCMARGTTIDADDDEEESVRSVASAKTI